MFYGAETLLVCIFSVSGAVGAVAPPVLWCDTSLDPVHGDALCRDHSLVFLLYIFGTGLADNQRKSRTTSGQPARNQYSGQQYKSRLPTASTAYSRADIRGSTAAKVSHPPPRKKIQESNYIHIVSRILPLYSYTFYSFYTYDVI